MLAAPELCRLQGFHRDYPLQRWSLECCVPRSTLQSAYFQLCEEEKAVLRAIGENKAKLEQETVAKQAKQCHWEQKALAKEQVGQ